MFKMSESNKLKLAEGTYILVVLFMISFIFMDTEKINFGYKSKSESKSIMASSNQISLQYKKYYNDQFGFSVDYPSDFSVQRDNDNKSGVSFYSTDNLIRITAYGVNNTPYETTEMLLKKDLSIIDGNLKDKTLNKDWYELSWVNNGTIYYRKVIVGTEAFNSLIISYPSNVSPINKSILEHLILSFKPGNLETVH